MPVCSGPTLAAPGTAAARPDQLPAGRPEAGPAFIREGVGADPPVAEGKGGPCRRPVQERAGVAAAIGAKAGHFQRQPVVAESGHWPANDGHTDKLPVADGCQRELVPDDGLMVTVV